MDTPHGDPRAWTREQVREWIAYQDGLNRDFDIQSVVKDIDGKELCRKPRGWFLDTFPGVGKQLCHDLRQRRDAIKNERMFGDERTAENRVVEGTRAAFLVMAFQICMIFYLLGKENLMHKASKILNGLYKLVDVVKRRQKNVDSGLFKEEQLHRSIWLRAESEATEVSLVHDSKCIAVSGKIYNKAVTTLCDAMEVIGAPLTIKVQTAWWKKATVIALVGVGLAVGGAAVYQTYFTATSTSASASFVGMIISAFMIGSTVYVTYRKFHDTELKTAVFTSNYLRAILLSRRIVDKSQMMQDELERIIDNVNFQSRDSAIQEVEREMMKTLPHISTLQSKLSDWKGDINTKANFEYRATAWLHPDTVKDINDSIMIAYIQFGMRNLVRDVFILGVIGPEGNSKKELMKSVFPNAAHKHKQSSCDIVLYDGSEYTQSTVPVLLFPSGESDVMEATRGLWTRTCAAFICVLDYTSGTPDLRDLEAVAELCVPVLLCINTKGRVKSQGEADRARERYKSKISWDLRDLVQVVLCDVSGTDRSPWITGGGDVKYWVEDALDHHQEHAHNVDKVFNDSLVVD